MLSAFSVKRPYTVLVAVVLVIVLGLVSFTGMTTDLLPSMDLPYIVVMTSYPGASPEQVELSVTRPLEALLSTSGGLNNISSVSRENSSMIFLEYTQGTNMDSATIELSGSLDLLSDQLPDEIGRPMLMRISPDMLPVMIASVDMQDADLTELSALLEDEILPGFERINGVASVSAEGMHEERILISLQQNKIDDLNDLVIEQIEVKLDQTRQQLEEAKEELASGRATLEAKLPDQQKQLADASVQLNDAIAGIQAILAEETILQAQQAAFEHEKAALEAVLEQVRDTLPDSLSDINYADFFNQPVDIAELTEEARVGFEQLVTILSRLAALETELQNINVRLLTLEAMQPELEKGLLQSQSAYRELEQGKITLAIEISQAKTQIEQGEAELEKGLAELDNAREEALNQAGLQQMINPQILSQLLKAQNFSMPAGYVNQGDNQYLVKVGDSINSPEDLENLLLFSLEATGDIRLADVAQIEISDNSNDTYARINGQPGIVLTFQKQSNASTAEVTGSIHEIIGQYTSQYENLQIVALMDQGDFINLITGSVLQNLLWGGLLALLVLLLFLKDIRPTLVIAFSIPISLMFAVTLMYFSNVTLNIVSLSGLALGIGMLVDNSIVVIENIYRLRHEGMSPVRAAVKGTTQMSGAIIASTLTTICVFLPIVFTEGLSRELFSDMGLTITFSLIASLLVALSLVPSLSSTMLRQNKEKSHPWFDKLVRVYTRTLRVSLKYKFIALVLALGLFALSIFGATIMGLAFIPEMDSPQMSASLSLPQEEQPGSNLELIDKVSERIMSLEAVEYVGAMSSGAGFGFASANEISFYILLKEQRDLTNRDVERLIYENTADIEAEIVVQSSTMDLSALGGSGIQLMIKGTNLDSLDDIATEIASIVKDVEGIANIEWQGQSAESEIRVIVDKDEATRHNLTVAQVFQALSTALQDNYQATAISSDLDDLPVLIINPEKENITRDNIKNYIIETKDREGNELRVPLDSIASIEEGISPSAISRDNQSRYITVSIQIADGYNVSLVNRDITAALEDYQIPEGYTIDMAGENETILEALEDLILVVILAVLLIYLIMVAQFQSLLAPFIILFTIPLAFTGGLLLIWVLGVELSVIAMLGFLVLTGIVVNNGIVFISTVNQLRLEGNSKQQALLQTGSMRLRPILMTALTTILAMSTLALGLGRGAEMTQPMAIVTIGGLSYATILTLYIVPIIYDIFHKKEIKQIDLGDEDNV